MLGKSHPLKMDFELKLSLVGFSRRDFSSLPALATGVKKLSRLFS
jgi:hypothetical protein